jgi:hypothetical protein
MSDTSQKQQRCAATRKDGQPCLAKPTATGLCLAHDPRANQWRILGGRNSRTAERAGNLMPDRLAPLVRKLELVFDQLFDGQRDVKEATAMASIAVAIGKLISTGEIEMRTRELERMAREAMARPEKWA